MLQTKHKHLHLETFLWQKALPQPITKALTLETPHRKCHNIYCKWSICHTCVSSIDIIKVWAHYTDIKITNPEVRTYSQSCCYRKWINLTNNWPIGIEHSIIVNKSNLCFSKPREYFFKPWNNKLLSSSKRALEQPLVVWWQCDLDILVMWRDGRREDCGSRCVSVDVVCHVMLCNAVSCNRGIMDPFFRVVDKDVQSPCIYMWWIFPVLRFLHRLPWVHRAFVLICFSRTC